MNRTPWSRYSRNTAATVGNRGGGNSGSSGSVDPHSAYDREEEIGGCGLGSNMWVVAEACKVKDALFLGNVMAVQDANFLVMNKIAYCIKCQTGFAVAQTMKRAGVNYAVINLLGAFLDHELPVQTKDTLLDNFCVVMEAAAEQGVGVLLYSFQDLAWCCFSVMAYWLRKYKWTVEHTLRIIKSRRPTLELPDAAMSELHALAARIKAREGGEGGGFEGRYGGGTVEEEESLLTNTCSNAGLARGGTNHAAEELGGEALASPLTRARPLTADTRSRIKWGAGDR
ncbi:MAG: hypothetical protein ACPIOQ_67615, partial [Promethearchaeia archaeon]